MFKALVLRNQDLFSAQVEDLEESQLPLGDVLVDIKYSTLNYKDGLAITNKAPVVRTWPMVAGIDGSGTILESSHPNWKAGDQFIHNGWGVGETHWGCLSQRARLNGDWLVKLPTAFTSRQAMAIGTAGYTAMLCILALEKHGVKPSDGEVLVTGATGGVGSVAIALLSKLGYSVVAATGKVQEEHYLKSLGATSIIERQALSEQGKPFQKERWAGVVDSVGSFTLANVLAQTKYSGTVAACGLAQGTDLPSTVMPFILRGITLAGIDSVMAPLEKRQEAWMRLATDLDVEKLETMIEEIPLTQAIKKAQQLMDAKLSGRIVVKL
ncbi:MAG: MDR family oxidoreductase [Betaproteobacteria bacterium]